MSIRISVQWTNIQKFLKIIEGTLSVIDFDFSESPIQTELYKCYVKIEEGSISYSAIDKDSGIPTVLSHLLHEYTHSILKAYYNGFLLEDNIYTWVDSSHGFLPHEWAVKQYEALSESNKRNLETCCFSHNIPQNTRVFKTKIKEVIKRLENKHAKKNKSSRTS